MAKLYASDTTDYVAPTVEEYNTPQLDTTVATPTSVSSGLASEAEPLLTIFVKQLDQLHQFVIGRWPDNSQEGRRKFIIDNVKLFDNIANATPKIAKAAIQHFIGNVNSCPAPYISGTFNAPLYKSAPPRSLDVDRYFNLIGLLISIANEIVHVKRYVAGRDLNFILRKYSVKQRTTLIAVINSIGR